MSRFADAMGVHLKPLSGEILQSEFIHTCMFHARTDEPIVTCAAVRPFQAHSGILDFDTNAFKHLN
jgi:hypothetical protein